MTKKTTPLSVKKPLFGDLDEVMTSRDQRPPVSLEHIEALSVANDFPSRQPPKPVSQEAPQQPVINTPITQEVAPKKSRRQKTGRDFPMNVKVKRSTAALFNTIADEMGQPLGAVLEEALELLRVKLVEEGAKIDPQKD